jgi:dGTPase
MTFNFIRNHLNDQEKKTFSPYATLSESGIRRKTIDNIDTGYRQNFSVDVDRILHSLAYTRYIDKTQVFYLIKNDHITHRVLHVQLVSKIGRTIARFLGLNEDLVEAIALGHDLGHTPFGHDGEKFLSELCNACGIGCFLHNVQSVQFLEHVERKGQGWNLCLQTLDGILCHDGEVHNQMLEPKSCKTFEDLEHDMYMKKKNLLLPLIPMTLEGCVVRLSDTISYIGRDFEDAIRLDLIKRTDLPEHIADVLGNTNGKIVYNLVTDIIRESFQKNQLSFSSMVSEALRKLKMFNMQHIYLNPAIKGHSDTIKGLFALLFERYIKDIKQGNESSVIFTGYLKDMSSEYIHNHCNEEIVRDFISGMTDQYFLRQCPAEIRDGLNKTEITT